MGLSTLIPTVFVTGGRIANVQPSQAIAQLSIFTNLGSVIGPPLIGIVSTVVDDLRYALLIDAVLLCIVIYCGGGIFQNGASGKGSLPDDESVEADSRRSHDLAAPLIQ